MADDQEQPEGVAQQVQVDDSTLSVQLWAGVRQIAPPLMAFAIGRHWIADDLSVVLGIGGAILYPIIAGQLKTRARQKQLIAIARDKRVPDAVAVLKSQA